MDLMCTLTNFSKHIANWRVRGSVEPRIQRIQIYLVPDRCDLVDRYILLHRALLYGSYAQRQ